MPIAKRADAPNLYTTDFADHYLRPLWREILSKRFMILAGIGVTGVLLSTVIEAQLKIASLTLTSEEKLNLFAQPWFMNWHVLAGFCREVAFAAVIALIIIIAVERSSRQEQLNAATTMLGAVSDNVLKAVLSVSTPEPVVRQCMFSILRQPVIRHDMRLTFTVCRLPPELAQWRDTCLRLTIHSTYELENVSGNSIEHPISVHLPRAPYAQLDEYVMVRSVTLQDSQLRQDEVERGRLPDTALEKRYKWGRPIKKGERLRVAVATELVKEMSDNEIWASLLPSTSIEVVVDMRVPGHLWNVDALHPGRLTPLDAPAEGPYTERRIVFRSEEAILPFQSVVLYWRPDRQQGSGGTVTSGKDDAPGDRQAATATAG